MMQTEEEINGYAVRAAQLANDIKDLTNQPVFWVVISYKDPPVLSTRSGSCGAGELWRRSDRLVENYSDKPGEDSFPDRNIHGIGSSIASLDPGKFRLSPRW